MGHNYCCLLFPVLIFISIWAVTAHFELAKTSHYLLPTHSTHSL